jgi:CBS domain containing-hemolysin-like protein
VIVTAGIALFGEVTPKVLAVQAADRLALLAARPVELLMTLMRPIVVVFAAAPNILGRLIFGEGAKLTPTVTEAELRMLIDISAEEGAVGEQEAELMERVFHFYDRRVNEVMIPRTEVVWLESGTPLTDFYRVYDETPHFRFPVFRDSLDNVVGTVNIKDVLRAVAQGRAAPETPIDELMRPAYFVPETKLVGALFVGGIETVWTGAVTPPHGQKAGVYTPMSPTVLLRGREMGRFNMGSTVILLAAPRMVNWRPQLLAGHNVRVGMALGNLNKIV